MGWLIGWTYRKNHFVNPASGAGQNYQKRIIVHFGTGIDGDDDVYLDGKCLADFVDIRFTDSTGVFLLDYWMEYKVDSDYAIFWVEITDDLSVYDRKIYIYYDNAGATSIANGDNTFIFFDDFEVDLSRWNLGTPNATLSTDHAYSGIKSVKIPIYSLISHPQSPYDNIAVHAHLYDEMLPVFEYTVFSIDAGELEVSFIGLINDIAQYEYQLQGVTYNSGVDRTVGWHEFITRSSVGLKQFVIDGNIMPVTGTGTWNPRIFLITAATTQAVSYWDVVFYTKFVYPEPAHGAWGAEETDGGGGITTFVAEDIIDTISENFLTMEEIPYTLPQAAVFAEDIVPFSLFGSLHIPIGSEDILFSLIHERILIATDPLFSLLLTYHQPIPSEDIMLLLLAPRLWDVDIEFITGAAAAVTQVPLLHLTKKIIITTKGKIWIMS